MNPAAQSWMLLAGRLLMAALFIVAGVRKALAFGASAAYMTKNGIPMSDALLVVALIIEIGGGLLLILGWKTRIVATALFVFVVVLTPIFHAYWTFEPAQMVAQLNNFLKNLGLMGGLLYMMVLGAGALSLDERKPAAPRPA
jgi:putative oxidoreductase